MSKLPANTNYEYSSNHYLEALMATNPTVECPYCDFKFEKEGLVSCCPKCKSGIVAPIVAIKDLPPVGRRLYFYNTDVPAYITGYFITDSIVQVAWSSEKPLYEDENKTSGFFDITFLNSAAFFDKKDVPKDKYVVIETLIKLKTSSDFLNGKDYILDEGHSEELNFSSYGFNDYNSALAEFHKLLHKAESEYIGIEDNKHVYRINFVELCKYTEEIPEEDAVSSVCTSELYGFTAVKAD